MAPVKAIQGSDRLMAWTNGWMKNRIITTANTAQVCSDEGGGLVPALTKNGGTEDEEKGPRSNLDEERHVGDLVLLLHLGDVDLLVLGHGTMGELLVELLHVVLERRAHLLLLVTLDGRDPGGGPLPDVDLALERVEGRPLRQDLTVLDLHEPDRHNQGENGT